MFVLHYFDVSVFLEVVQSCLGELAEWSALKAP